MTEYNDESRAVRPRLYLDVDGCLCPFRNPDPAWGAVKRAEVTLSYGGGMAAKYKLIWAPPLIVALDALREEFGLELVWLTTWNELDAARDKLVPRFQGLAGGRVLELTPGPLKPGEARGYWKAQRILEDQASAPGPFIWIDDAEVELHGWKVLAATVGTPSLMIPPNSMVGLRVDEVERMRIWLQTTRLEG